MTKYRELLKKYEEAVKEAQKFADLYYKSRDNADRVRDLERKLEARSALIRLTPT